MYRYGEGRGAARSLLDLQNSESDCGGTCIQWFVVIIVVGALIILAVVGFVLLRLYRLRSSFHKGLVPLELFKRGSGKRLGPKFDALESCTRRLLGSL
jgi:hypothetical protein